MLARGFSLAVATGGYYSLVAVSRLLIAVSRLLIAVAFPVAKHGALEHRLGSCGAWA